MRPVEVRPIGSNRIHTRPRNCLAFRVLDRAFQFASIGAQHNCQRLTFFGRVDARLRQ
jgi:hypothetical protein